MTECATMIMAMSCCLITDPKMFVSRWSVREPVISITTFVTLLHIYLSSLEIVCMCSFYDSVLWGGYIVCKKKKKRTSVCISRGRNVQCMSLLYKKIQKLEVKESSNQRYSGFKLVTLV